MLAVLLDLLGQRSQQNSWSKHLFGLYLFATGTQRQTIAVLSSWGVCSSYSTLAGTQTSAKSKEESPANDEKTNLEIGSETTPATPGDISHDILEVVDDDVEGPEQSESESEASASSDSEVGEAIDVPRSVQLDCEPSNSDCGSSTPMDVDSPIEEVSSSYRNSVICTIAYL
ncbi:hypothetical protein BC629DRAFT_1486786 [Irpex lacteus]|nr:hypothetical protein BC629DRAFT_1486786 [Irpex lacteus]